MDSSNSNMQFLVGERIYLRPFKREDISYLKQWSNDPDVRRLTGEVTPYYEKNAEEFYDKISTDTSRIWFTIVLKESHLPIGEIGLLRMFHPWRTTDLSIIIGDKENWGKGYGSEAILLMLDYAFGYLNFHRIAIGVVGFNKSAIKFYEKIGFKVEGVQRDGYYYNHKYYDFIMMSILEDEYRQMHT